MLHRRVCELGDDVCMKRSLTALAFVLGSLTSFAACDSGGGDDIQPIDAAGDGSGTGSEIDAAGACILQPAIVNCTIGDNSPCTAMCANAYCFTFNQVGTLCTQPCAVGSTDQCPTGWSCNNMGRCRPPG